MGTDATRQWINKEFKWGFLVLESYLLQFNFKGGFSLKAGVDIQSAVSYSVNNKIQC